MSTPTASASDPIEVEIHERDEDEDPRKPLADQLESLGNHVTRFVVERPLTAVGIALAVGFLFGRMARR